MFTTSPFFWQMEKAYERNQELMGHEREPEASWPKSMDQSSHEEYMAGA